MEEAILRGSRHRLHRWGSVQDRAGGTRKQGAEVQIDRVTVVSTEDWRTFDFGIISTDIRREETRVAALHR
jgi:predicted aminopeptidase